MKHLRFVLAGVVVLLVVCLASFVPLGTYASNISSTIWQVIVLSSIPAGASVDSTIHQVQIVGGTGGASIPLSTLQGSQIGNFILDNGTTIISGPLTGDITGSNITPGFTTLSQIQGVPLVGALASNVAGQTWCTNALNQYVPCQLVNDQGTSISFKIDGTVGASATRWNVCPRTMRYAPGAGTSAPFVASYGIAGGNPGAITTYKFQDAGTEIIDGYLQTTGLMQFGTPGCSAGLSGTQGSGAFNRGAGPTTTVTIPSDATTTNGGIIGICSTLGTDGTGGYNNTGWTLPTGFSGVPNGCFSGTGISICAFEKHTVAGDLNASFSCTYSATHTSAAAVYTFKNVPASGEIVDTIAATRTPSSTSITFPGITPTANGDFLINILASAVSAGTLTSNPAPFTLGATSNGQGYESMWLGGKSASGSTSAVLSSSGTNYGVSIGLLTNNTACTLCTAGDKMEMLGPGTTSSETDVAVAINGVL